MKMSATKRKFRPRSTVVGAASAAVDHLQAAAGFPQTIEMLEDRTLLSAFTPGDLVVYRVGDSTTPAASGTATSVYLDEYTAGGTLVQSIEMPTNTTSGLALTDSGTASSAGQISLAANGSSVDLFGYDVATGTASATGSANETAGVVGVNGSPQLEKFNDETGKNARSSVLDPTSGTFYTSGGSGLFESGFSAGGTPTVASINTKGSDANVQIINGMVYYSQGSAVNSAGAEPTGTAAGSIVVTEGGSSPSQFFFANEGSGHSYNGAGDSLYIADNTATNGTLYKYVYNGTTWTAKGSITGPDTTTGDQILGVTGTVSGTTATIYFTEGGTTSTDVGDVYKFTDTYATTISNATSAPTRLVDVTANENFRGIVTAPDDGVGAIGGLGGITTAYNSGSPTAIGPSATFSDGSNFMGGQLTAVLSGAGATSSDTLGLLAGNGITFTGTNSGNVLYSGNLIGTYTLTSGAASALTVNFNPVGAETVGNTAANPVSSTAVQALIDQIAFSTSGAAGTNNRTVTFQVTENGGASDTAVTQNLTVSTAPLTLSANTGLTLAQSASATITSSNLSYSDTSTTPSNVTYTITTAPTMGTVFKNTTALTTGSTFTQADINNGLIKYTQNGSDTTNDSFAFTVSDPLAFSALGTFGIAITAPILVNDNPVTVQAGAAVALSTAALDTAESGKTSSQLTYTIGTAPVSGTLTDTHTSATLTAGATFTQADINSGYITYTNTTTTPETDTFTFTVTDGGAGSTGTQTFTFNVNHPPALAVNTGLSVNPGQGATITSSMLSVTDPDQGPAALIYTVGTAPLVGTLYSGTTALAAGSTFTQANVNSGLINYVSTGTSAASDSFSFTVSDGAGGTLASATFALNVVALSSVSYTGNTDTYTQDFDGLPSSGTYTLYSEGPIGLDTSSIPTTGLTGWEIGNTTATQKFAVDDGAGATTGGAVYSFGAGTDTPGYSVTAFNNTPGTANDPSTDRALGMIGTSTLPSTVGVMLVNNSGVTLNQISVSYEGQVWHFGTGATANPLTFGYSLGAASILDSTKTFAGDTNLNYSVTPPGTANAVDGNASGNFSLKNDTIGSLNWTAGETLVLRWQIGGVGQAPGLAIDNFQFTADAAPVVTTNTGLGTAPSQTAYITSSMLDTTDADNTATQLTYTVTSLPTNGALLINGVAQTSTGGTFTQAQLNTGAYVSFQAGSSTVSGSFGFTVADPYGAIASGTPSSTSFTLGIGDTPPTLAANTGLSLVQGATATITSSELKVTDPIHPDSQETFTIGTAPAYGTLYTSASGTPVALAAGSTFTQQDLDNGSISYANTNNSSNTNADSFTFSVSDGSTGTISTTTFNITVSLVPTLVNSTGFSTPIGAATFISKSMLEATGATGAGSSSQIEFTLTSVPSEGKLYNTAVSTTTALAVGSTFFQNAINGTSTIEYISNAGATPGSSDTFSFDVTDTSYPSGNQPSIGPDTFTITVNPALSTIPYYGTTYTQNFSSLPTTNPTLGFIQSGPFDLSAPVGSSSATNAQGVGAAGMTGWSFGQIGGTTVDTAKFGVDNGSTSTGSVFSYYNGTLGPSLGMVSTPADSSAIGLTLVNNSGSTLTQFTLSYDGEEWRIGADNALNFSYKVGGTSPLDASGFTSVTALGYDGTTGTAAANSSITDTLVSSTVSGLSWGPGQTLVLRWNQTGGVGSAEGLAINNVIFASPLPSLPTGVTASGGAAYSYTSTANSVSLSLTSGTLTFGQDVGSPSSLALNVSADGAGTSLVFNSTQHLNSLTLTNGAMAQLAANGSTVLDINSLSIPGAGAALAGDGNNTAQGTLDVTNNSVIINYGSGTDPINTIVSLIDAGYANDQFTGTGITTSMGSNRYAVGFGESLTILGPSGGTFRGQSVGPQADLISYARFGDTNLNGSVDFNDLSVLLQNYGGTTQLWDLGNFTEDATVSFNDLSVLLQNYGFGINSPSVAPAVATTPLTALALPSAATTTAASPTVTAPPPTPTATKTPSKPKPTPKPTPKPKAKVPTPTPTITPLKPKAKVPPSASLSPTATKKGL